MGHLQPFIEQQIRSIKGETVSSVIFLCCQHPGSQSIGSGHRHQLQQRCCLEVSLLETLNDRAHKGGIRLDDLIELSDSPAELTLNAMLTQSGSDPVVLLAEEVLARVGQKVVMADEIRS